jgi:hypothetical protein
VKLVTIAGDYSVCRLATGSTVSVPSEGFSSLTSTAEEVSLVCLSKFEPVDARVERGWSLLKIDGVLDFSLVGILSEISGLLAHAKISLFAVSTFDTDYILVRDLPGAVRALRSAGHELP